MEKLIPRKLLEEIKKFKNRREIIGIRGPRQAGKTTLMKIIESQLKNTAFINLDIPENRRVIEETPLDFIKRYKNKKPLYLFLDEIQRLKDGESIKIIYDTFEDVKIFFSGSSSLEIKSKILTYLVGRLFLFELFPFDFEEFLIAKDPNLSKILKEKINSVREFIESKRDYIDKPSFYEEFLRYWKEYVIFGGYPEVVKTDDIEIKKKIIQSIKDLYIERDIIQFFKIEETSKFEDFAKILSFSIGNLLSLNSISKEQNINYKKLEEFLEILKNTYIVSEVKPFFKNLITEIKKTSKIYFYDLGLRNSLIKNFLEFDNREDKGKILENFVFRELISNFKDFEIRYWRTTGKAEVDFVLLKENVIVPIEVKYSGSLGRSFHSFLETYKPERAIVVTLDKFEEKRIKNTKVYFIPVFML
jgi:hypothetical protein